MNTFEELLQEIIRNGDDDGDGVQDSGEECDNGNTNDDNDADAALEEWFSKLAPTLER